MKKKATDLLKLGVVFIIVGTLALGLDIYTFIDYRSVMKDCSAETTGIIEEVQVEEANKGVRNPGTHLEYRAVISYMVPSSDTPLQLVTVYRREESFDVGKQVTVMYDPNDPGNAYTTELKPDTGFGISVISLIFILSGVLMIRSHLKHKDSTQ